MLTLDEDGHESARRTIMCERKTKFSRHLAAKVGARLGYRMYRCPYCNAFHLTSK